VRAGIRSDDVAARIGGDELLILLNGVHDLGEAAALADAIRVAASRPIQELDQVMSATVSIGVTMARPGEDVDELMSRADRAMYLAKDAGRNQVVTLPAPEG
jgi:diguanylate cyclase (GGDEF)-like protein